MYTVVMLAALTTAPSTQAWHRGCHGCHGCHGGYVAGNTCWYGNGYGCSGCYGCYGCAYGGGTYAGYAGYGVPFPGMIQCHGCYGCYGGWSCYGYPTQQALVEAAPPSMPPPAGNGKPAPKKGFEEVPLQKEKKAGGEQARARVIIDLPEDARLFIDGNLMQTKSSRRTFQTPDLAPGQQYFYDLRAEVVRDGQTISSSQRLILRPGQAATASFADLGQPRDAAARAGK